MTACSYAASKPNRKPLAGSSSPIAFRKSRRKAKSLPSAVKAGDRILFGKWSGTEVKVNGEDLIIMKESDILGIIG